jgi:hypothetical protein
MLHGVPPPTQHAEIRYWNAPGTPADQVTATALRALNAITGRTP